MTARISSVTQGHKGDLGPLMRANIGKFGLVLALLVSACGNRGQENAGPDEFLILPGKPLQTPPSFSDLPDPTPGGSNITDPTPNADAISVLGGNPSALSLSGAPATDGALLTYTSRYGVDPDAGAVPKKRRRPGLFSGQALDPYKELERLRALGVKTPSAPPPSGG